MNPSAPRLELRHPERHIWEFQTEFGWREQYDCVAHCTRCGCCAQTCPIYQIKHQESFSPRGRNQTLRLVLEKKLNLTPSNPTLIALLESCTLCGRCTQACAGKIPTAEHVLELRRTLHLRVLPRLLFSFLRLRDVRPQLFAKLTRIALFLRRWKAIKLLRVLQFTKIPGLSWLNRLDDMLPNFSSSLDSMLTAEEKNLCAVTAPTAIYLPSLEAEFILPQIARRTLDLIKKQQQTPVIWRNFPTGLFAYIYADVYQSRRTLLRLMRRHTKTAHGKLPLVTDSIDIYLFLKRAPQLFRNKKYWQIRAQKLADCTRFVTDYLPPVQNTSATSVSGNIRLDSGSLFERVNGILEQIRQICYTLFGKNFVECSYTDADTPAFGYAFSAQNCAEQIGLKTVEAIARTQTKKVFVLSGLAALELNYFLKRFYPAAQAQHVIHINE